MSDTSKRLNEVLEGRYRIERELGEGGMATVYLADDRKHERKVAIKVLRPELAAVLGAERFLTEIRVTANLQHPHILPLYDSGEAEGLLYYVMPFVMGESLRDRLDRERQLPVEDALRIAAEVADALSHAHGLGIVHRDIKPGNILLTDDHAIVADFGIAKAVSSAWGERMTSTGLSPGTPLYMSPEQASGDAEVDGRSDEYSLGCVLYEMLAGEPPFTGPSPRVILAKALTEPAPSVRESRDTVPPHVDAALRKALSRLPADRFGSLRQFADALLQVAGTAAWNTQRLAPDPFQPPKDRRVVPWASSYPARILLGGAALGLTLVAGWHLWPRAATDAGAEDELQTNRIAIPAFHDQTNNPDLALLGEITSDWISSGLTGMPELAVVPGRVARDAVAADTTGNPLPALAHSTRSALLVTGSYLQRGDAVEISAQILDGETLELLYAVGPHAGAISDPMSAVGALAQEVAGRLGQHFAIGREASFARLYSAPPSYEAFAEYHRAETYYVADRYQDAIPPFRQALELAPEWATPLIRIAWAHYNLGQWASVDSLVQIGREFPDLTRVEQIQLERLEVGVKGDQRRHYELVTELLRINPWAHQYQAGFAAIRINRPGEAVGHLSRPMEIPGLYLWANWWGQHAAALHMLGRYAEALEVARAGQEAWPRTRFLHMSELEQLAALGHFDEAAAGAVALLDHDLLGQSPGLVFRQVARELEAHGGPEAMAREMYERAVADFRSRSAAVGLAESLYSLGFHDPEAWNESREVYLRFLEADPTNPRVLGRLGTIAARQRQPEAAREYLSRIRSLERPYLRGSDKSGRASIHAALGEVDEAIPLLADAFHEGVAFGTWIHVDPDLRFLADEPEFQALIRPKG